MTLVEFLGQEEGVKAFIADGALLIDDEVARKKGMRGMALKAGFKAVKAVKPGVVSELLEKMLPGFAPAVDPHFAKGREHGDLRAYFTEHAEEIAQSMLGVTDARAERAKHRGLLKVYKSLRPMALKHTMEALPGVADLLVEHVP